MLPAFEQLKSLNSSQAEANVESLLREVLTQMDPRIEWILQSSKDRKREDLTSSQLQVIIECKRRGTVDLSEAESQLAGYLKNRQVAGDERSWIGFITDGRFWWGYQYSFETRQITKIDGVVEYEASVDYETLENFCKTYILSRFDPSRRPEADIDKQDLLESMFFARHREVERLQKKVEGTVGYQTKINLWESQLQGSGIIPPRDEPGNFSDHFSRHSFIVIVSRMLRHYLSVDVASDEDLIETASDGFHAWVLESEDGHRILQGLAEDLRRYSWRNITRDVLKSLYHGLIPRDKRKEFGEYYTPDELAKSVVNRVLDDEWCDQQIVRAFNIINGQDDDRRGLGVLDPACGSGTFLFHAARRLKERIASHHHRLMKHTSEIVAQLVFGIDIHPIAVEMSKATLLMALPESASPPRLNIALGDSMQMGERPDDVFEGQGLRVSTPKGNEILLSNSILSRPSALDVISWAVQRHNPNQSFSEKRAYETDEECVLLSNSIAKVIGQEDNHVWSWHLSNCYTLHTLISSSVGRLIGNPPWLVSNDTRDGLRKKTIREMRKTEGMYQNVGSYLAEGDLASVFTARVTRLYLDTSRDSNRYAWVLPGSALINQVWSKWRSGKLAGESSMHHELAWSLDEIEPPIFEHAPNGTCVVFGRKERSKTDSTMVLERWSGRFDVPEIVEDTLLMSENPSDYLSKVKRGCFFGPFHYFVVDTVLPRTDRLWSIETQMGTKKQWKGKSHQGVVEKEALLPLVTSKDLKPPQCEQKQYLIAPVHDGQLMLPGERRKQKFPLVDEFWSNCNREFKQLKTDGATDILETNYGFPGSIESQLAYRNLGGG